MKQSELYQKPADESFQHRTNRKARGSMTGETEQRIVTLYAGGHSIESITKEVGRARHVVVHMLQTKGVFGNRPTEQREESMSTEHPKEEPESEAQIAAGKPAAAKALRKLTTRKPKATKVQLPEAKKTPVTGRWSPPVQI